VTQQTALDMSPPEFLQLAGHPLRWQLLGELARSDRTVQELAGRADEAHNLVSYHLGKLRDAGLVVARRSSADGRDTYYTADLTRVGALFTATAGALHPALGAPVPPGGSARAGTSRVLFLCTGNSARSQIAEVLVRERSAGAVQGYSAGSHPKPLHRNAIRVMREEYGVDLSGHASKHLSVFADEQFDWVISLCDRVREVCPEFPGEPETIHWSLPDPAAGHDDDEASYPAFRRTAAELDTRIGFLLAVLTDDAPAS
jgi:protein-tyrosine-phosphatase/DNA-binding transcriptional ArsR family regulator